MGRCSIAALMVKGIPEETCEEISKGSRTKNHPEKWKLCSYQDKKGYDRRRGETDKMVAGAGKLNENQRWWLHEERYLWYL